MRKIILGNRPQNAEVIYESEIPDNSLIVAFDKGRIAGFISKETEGFIARINSFAHGSSGHHASLSECLKHDSQYFTFAVVEGGDLID